MPLLRILLLLLLPAVQVAAQQQVPGRTPQPNAEVLYDRPGEIKRLFLGIQPLYGEFFTANVNAGFGIDAHYFHARRFDARLQYRQPWASRFFDQGRENARRNSDSNNPPVHFNMLEAAFSYHILDGEKKGKLKVIVYDKRLKGQQWAATVPETISLNGQVRTILAARAGLMRWQSTFNVSAALNRQGASNAEIGLPETYLDAEGNAIPLQVFSNIRSVVTFAGVGYARIRNAAIGFQKSETTLDDGIMSFYADVMYAPSLRFDDVAWSSGVYPLDGLSKTSLGYRIGMDSKFNRVIGLGIGAEAGKRPGPRKDNFYMLLKVSFPVLGSNLLFRKQTGK